MSTWLRCISRKRMFQNAITKRIRIIKHCIIRFGLHQFVPFLIDILDQRVKWSMRINTEESVMRIPKWIYRFLCYEIGRCALKRWVKVRSKCQRGSFNSWPANSHSWARPISSQPIVNPFYIILWCRVAYSVIISFIYQSNRRLLYI